MDSRIKMRVDGIEIEGEREDVIEAVKRIHPLSSSGIGRKKGTGENYHG